MNAFAIRQIYVTVLTPFDEQEAYVDRVFWVFFLFREHDRPCSRFLMCLMSDQYLAKLPFCSGIPFTTKDIVFFLGNMSVIAKILEIPIFGDLTY